MDGVILDTSMVQNCRNMTDTIRSRRKGGAQRQIMKLSPFKVRSQKADLLNQRPAVDGKIADIVLGEQQVRIPAGLEPWIGALAGGVYLITVRIDDVWTRISGE